MRLCPTPLDLCILPNRKKQRQYGSSDPAVISSGHAHIAVERSGRGVNPILFLIRRQIRYRCHRWTAGNVEVSVGAGCFNGLPPIFIELLLEDIYSAFVAVGWPLPPNHFAESSKAGEEPLGRVRGSTLVSRIGNLYIGDVVKLETTKTLSRLSHWTRGSF